MQINYLCMNLWYISRQSALKLGEGDTRSNRRQSEVDKITTVVAKCGKGNDSHLAVRR